MNYTAARNATAGVAELEREMVDLFGANSRVSDPSDAITGGQMLGVAELDRVNVVFRAAFSTEKVCSVTVAFCMKTSNGNVCFSPSPMNQKTGSMGEKLFVQYGLGL